MSRFPSRFLGGGVMSLRQLWEVFAMKPSQASSTDGRMKMLTSALMTAPRASIEQMLLMISIFEMSETPKVAQKKTEALVMIDLSEALEAILIASTRSCPFCSS